MPVVISRQRPLLNERMPAFAAARAGSRWNRMLTATAGVLEVSASQQTAGFPPPDSCLWAPMPVLEPVSDPHSARLCRSHAVISRQRSNACPHAPCLR